MKKALSFIFILVIVFIVACQKAVKEEAVAKAPETPKAVATGEAAVDAVGNDLNNVNSVEKDLGTDQLKDLDSGLADIQNI